MHRYDKDPAEGIDRNDGREEEVFGRYGEEAGGTQIEAGDHHHDGEESRAYARSDEEG